MNGRSIWLMAALSVGCAATVVAAEPAPLSIAVVQVPPDSTPEGSFTLLRDGRPLSVVRDMLVRNGDRVVSRKGQRVTVAYVHPECGEKDVRNEEEHLVHCSPAAVGAAGAFASYLKSLLPFVLKPERIKETSTFTPRGAQDLSCFPKLDLRMSSWPPPGATLLAGAPALFRWEGTGTGLALCSPATLLIDRVGGHAVEAQMRKNIRVGELITIDGPLSPGSSYEWAVADPDGGGMRSPRYGFSVLDREDSERIRRQMEEVAAANPEHPAVLVQALYLQVLSDATPGLDLYADSFRLTQGQDPASDLFKAVAARVAEHQ